LRISFDWAGYFQCLSPLLPGNGLPAGERAFLVCSFWLVDNYILQGRHAEARKLFDRLLSRCNDVELPARVDLPAGRTGDFPQAYSHVGLINGGLNLTRQTCPAEERVETSQPAIVTTGTGITA
jgi:hypothetical protein